MENLREAEVVLRDVTEDDVVVFFEQQLDPVGGWMVAFASQDRTDWPAFAANSIGTMQRRDPLRAANLVAEDRNDRLI